MTKTIRDYQQKVDQTVRVLGGYWRPLSGLARVIEELGELAELFMQEEMDREDLGGELADLFVITASVGNQYCMDLNEEFSLMAYPIEIEELYKQAQPVSSKVDGVMSLLTRAGQIARILNHYEGDKKKKPTEKKRRLGEEIAKFNIDLIALANLNNIPLFTYVNQILDRDVVRDKNRFDITHDPTTEPSLDHFRELTKGTPYESLKKVWGSYEWDESLSLEKNLQNTLPTFQRFGKVGENEGLEALVLEIVGEEFISDEENRNKTIQRTLQFFHQFDPYIGQDPYVNDLGLHELTFRYHFYGVEFDWVPMVHRQSLFLLFIRSMS
ncbi:nucleoside triphosphate pyrophosphohydrolase family protein [Tepidibacillus decaturensis]|uniref:NTP pyrophosphohydrolase MazG putative catalytic core domain-containing protein n=1 Tax=Tepidibacillus decaturensis TaxID=1413211 RepID=A0A135L1W1_9BACI|nr:hypothetical protein [Tepidibacillus decaturensis]KXG42940.1 hypothetical protein U473_02035 [Tepidibacillus decaturensis]